MGPRQYLNHPDPMDLWLESLGYYRKITARDGSCLFRAVAEQLFYTQRYHVEVRKQCVDYLTEHPELLNGLELEESVETYLELLQNPSQCAGQPEIDAMSLLFKVNIVVFRDIGVQPPELNAHNKTLMLCASQDHHYDSVYHKDYTKIAGFCQSLVYEVLYKNVFQMKDVDYAVDKMLHYKPLRNRNDIGASSPRKLFNFNCSSLQFQRKGVVEELLGNDLNVKELLNKGITPFPYKVAKSLDPNIFRNVEFDVWIDYRRGLRLGYFDSNNDLRVGVKCLVKMDDEGSYVGHIQEMSPDKGPVVLFVEEFGEKRTVPYENLEVLPQEPSNNKPWQMNYHGQKFGSPTSSRQTSTPPSESGNKIRKGHDPSDLKSCSSPKGMQYGGGRSRNRKISQSNAGCDSGDLNVTNCQADLNMMAYSTAPTEAYIPYQGYQVDAEMGIPIMVDRSLQFPVLPSSPVSPLPLLVPLSPTPDDLACRYAPFTFPTDSKDTLRLATGSSSTNHSHIPQPSDFIQFEPSGALPDVLECPPDIDEASEDYNSNSMSPESAKSPLQINFNAPKSVLDNGADLPMSDIQTLRFFYNLGNEVYKSQCVSWNTSGGYQTSICSSGCTALYGISCTALGSNISCPGKCGYNTSIDNTFHDNSTCGGRRKRRETTVSSPGGVSMSSESEVGEGLSRIGNVAPAPSSSVVAPRFKKDAKAGKPKGKEGKPEDGAVGPSTASSVSGKRSADASSRLEPLVLTDISSKDLNEHLVSTMAVPFGTYVCYPNSPVVPYSPVETEPALPYFPSCRVQYQDYLGDGRQQCYSAMGDVSPYATSAQYPFFTPSSHYIFPASPGIYVGPPPSWTTMSSPGQP